MSRGFLEKRIPHSLGIRNRSLPGSLRKGAPQGSSPDSALFLCYTDSSMSDLNCNARE